MRTDLHIHTTASDGRWTPEEVVAQVQREGIQLFAIADHETVANVPPTAALAHQAGLAFLPGVEVSSRLNGQLFHILGYGVNPLDRGLDNLLAANTARLDWVNEESMRRVAQAGHPVDLEEYAAYQYDPSRGGWKSLNYLIDKGLCRDVHDFFSHLFVDPIRPPVPDFPPPSEVAAAIRIAGGVPILAHPGASLREQGASDETLAPFLDFGVVGLECYSSYHDPETTQVCLSFCDRHNLLVTGGSDCHGGFAGRRLGIPYVDTADLRLGELEDRILR